MYEERESNSGLHLASILLGVAAGIAGTILYATYNEKGFGKVVGKTRELSDRSTDYVGEITDNVRHKAENAVETARTSVEHLSNGVRQAVANVTHSAEHATDKLANSAKKAIDA